MFIVYVLWFREDFIVEGRILNKSDEVVVFVRNKIENK